MTKQISRRQALAGFGSVSLGALLAACTDSDGAVTSTSVATSDGATASVEPQSPVSSDLASLFDDATTCSLTPQETEGPYYFDVDSIRSDIREDRTGATLRLGVRVQDAAACTAIANAVVETGTATRKGATRGSSSRLPGKAEGPARPTRRRTSGARRSRTPTASSSS